MGMWVIMAGMEMMMITLMMIDPRTPVHSPFGVLDLDLLSWFRCGAGNTLRHGITSRIAVHLQLISIPDTLLHT